MKQVPTAKEIAGLSKQEKRAMLENLLRKSSQAERVPLSEAQLRLWELEAHQAPHSIHSFAIAYDLRGQLHPGPLEQAIQAVAARHDALRMRIITVGDAPFLQVSPLGSSILDVRDCSTQGDDREKLLRQEATHPLSLVVGPAWRCVLLQFAEDDSVLFLQFHHIIADRWSAAIFVGDLGTAYRAALEGQAAFSDEPPPSLAHALQQHQQFPRDPEIDSQLTYWKNLFSNAPQMLEIPSSHSGEAFSGYEGNRIEANLDANSVAVLKALAAEHSTTIFSVLLAGFAVMLRAHTGQEDMVICTPMTGRHRAGTRGVIGYFNNIIPLRLDLSGDPSFASLVGRMASQALAAYAHQDVPLRMISELPELAGLRLSRCLFALQNIPGLNLQIPGVVADHRDIANGSANFDLSLFLEEKDGRLLILLEYKTSVMDAALAQGLMARFLECLQRVAAQPGACLSQFPRYSRPGLVDSPQAAAPKADGKSAAVDSHLEQKMINIWRELFSDSKQAIHAESQFFELGGDSMRAARLFGRIETEFGQELPLATLFEAPTPRQLVQRMCDKEWVAPWKSLIPVCAAGSRPPLFCVGGGGGNVVSFRIVADCLHSDQPVYCLQAKGLRKGDLPFSSVEEMAAHYLDAVRPVVPHGPYLLTGHSFGALVAYEMAQRLVEQGEEVSLLALIDYPGPDVRLTRMDWIRYHLISLSMLPMRERIRYISRGLSWRFQTAKAKRRIRIAQNAAGGDDFRARWSSIDVLEQSMRAIRNYQIKPFPGCVTLFRGRHSNPSMVIDPQGGWGRVALEGVDLIEVPGGHLSIFKEPHIRELGAALARCLDHIHSKTKAEVTS